MKNSVFSCPSNIQISIIRKIKMPTQPPIVKKLSKKLHHINASYTVDHFSAKY